MATKATITIIAETKVELRKALEEVERMVGDGFTSAQGMSEKCEFSFVADHNFVMGSGPAKVV